jgi:hypothetical protein
MPFGKCKIPVPKVWSKYSQREVSSARERKPLGKLLKTLNYMIKVDSN